MESFCDSLPDGKIADDLYEAIRGKRAFRRFKDTVIHYDIAQNWYDYLNAELETIARDWCEENELTCV